MAYLDNDFIRPNYLYMTMAYLETTSIAQLFIHGQCLLRKRRY